MTIFNSQTISFTRPFWCGPRRETVAFYADAVPVWSSAAPHLSGFFQPREANAVPVPAPQQTVFALRLRVLHYDQPHDTGLYSIYFDLLHRLPQQSYAGQEVAWRRVILQQARRRAGPAA